MLFQLFAFLYCYAMVFHWNINVILRVKFQPSVCIMIVTIKKYVYILIFIVFVDIFLPKSMYDTTPWTMTDFEPIPSTSLMWQPVQSVHIICGVARFHCIPSSCITVLYNQYTNML